MLNVLFRSVEFVVAERQQKQRERFGSSKLSLSPQVIYYRPFQGGTSIVVLLCYMLCLFVYDLQQYGQLNNSCRLCLLFYSVLLFKIENRYK